MKSMKSRDDTAKTEYCLVPLQSKAQVEDFLKAIQQNFVSNVDPLESGLQDILFQRGVLTETDNESLGGGHLPTRGEKARHLWKLLSNINHGVFISDVLPVLGEKYYHIIPARFWRPRDSACTVSQAGSDRERPGATSTLEPASAGDSPECTRCAMSHRIRLSTLSDFAFKIGVITKELYCDLTKNVRISEPDWSPLFSAFATLPKPAAERHCQEMTTLLQRHSLHVPDNLVDLMTRGFPCQCSAVQLPLHKKVDAVKMKTTKKKLEMWLLLDRLNDRSSDVSMTSEASSASVYPPSESDDGSHTSFDTESLSSVRSELSETSLEQATAAGIPALPGLRQLAGSGNFRTENASDCTQVAAFSRRVDGVGTVSLPRSRGATPSQARFNKWNTWHSRKGLHSSKLLASGENSLQGTPSGSQESLVSAILRELWDDENPAEAHRRSSECLAETGSIDDSSNRVASGQPPDCVSREPHLDLTAHHLVLRGTSFRDSDSDDCVISKMRQDDDVSQEKKSEQLHTSDVIPVEPLSHPRSSDLVAKHTDESTALEKDSTENLHTSFDDVMCGAAVERARQNTDLMEFLDFASSEVTTTEELRELLKKAVIVDVDARDEAAHLLEDYTDLECRYTELCPKLEELQQQSAAAETAEHPERPPSPPPPEDNPGHSQHGAAVSEVFQLCSQMQNSCENMLASRRTFIMCALYLNTLPRLTSQSTRDKANTVARDAMVLLESTSLETWQLVLQLDELREELPSGAASSLLHEVISLMRAFLDSS